MQNNNTKLSKCWWPVQGIAIYVLKKITIRGCHYAIKGAFTREKKRSSRVYAEWRARAEG